MLKTLAFLNSSTTTKADATSNDSSIPTVFFDDVTLKPIQSVPAEIQVQGTNK